MTTTTKTFDATETKAIEAALEGPSLARVNPMGGGGIVIEAHASREAIELELARACPALGLTVSWDPGGGIYGAIVRGGTKTIEELVAAHQATEIARGGRAALGQGRAPARRRGARRS